MTSHIAAVTFDCENAATLARFWSEVLGRSVDEGQPEAGEFFASIGRGGSPGDGPVLMFIKVPEGKTAKNRVHLDINIADRDTDAAQRRVDIDKEIDRLLALGATRIEDFDVEGLGVWSVMNDPEGNEFCVH